MTKQQLSAMLSGDVFSLPRGYGHADYRIIGGPEFWAGTRDALRLYFRFVNGFAQVQDHPDLTPEVYVLTVVRLGGFDGPVQPEKAFPAIVAKRILGGGQNGQQPTQA